VERAPGPVPVALRPVGEASHELLDLDALVEEARRSGDAWREFLRAGMFSAGIYRLAAGAADPQTPHEEDEVYLVLTGRAVLEVAGERHPVGRGSVAFVAKRVEHRFTDIDEDLEVLVLFAPPESA
jgi:mannose-6-phosphate isomerase-like protein (cupin superfamily)